MSSIILCPSKRYPYGLEKYVWGFYGRWTAFISKEIPFFMYSLVSTVG
jgi:hypothetical protein